MNMNPREYFPLVTARESYLRQLDYFEVKHPHYDTLHREFRFLIDDLFKIMKDNNTLSRYPLISEKLTELRKSLTLIMSNQDCGEQVMHSNDRNTKPLVGEPLAIKSDHESTSKSDDEQLSLDEFLAELTNLMKSS